MDRRIGKKTVGRLIACPYNPAHRIEEGHRFQTHLIICSKDHPEAVERACQFNSQHRVKITEYQHHLTVCPDLPIRQLTEETSKFNMNFKEKLAKPAVIPTCDEDWGDEASPPVQIPTYTTKKTTFINSDNLSGLKPAEKKELRKKRLKGELYDNQQTNGFIVDKASQSAAVMKTYHSDQSSSNPQPLQQQPLKLPTRKPIAADLEHLRKVNAGRGSGGTGGVLSSRLAANFPGFTAVQVPPSSNGEDPNFGLAGIGRGRARLPKRMPLAVTKFEKPNVETPVSPSTSCSGSSETEPNPNELRKVKKKLRQIENLELKLISGAELNEEELTKLSLKERYMEQLKSLED